MTEPLIKLPSVIEDELRAELAEQKAMLADQNSKIVEQKAMLADKDVELKSKEAEIQHLKQIISQLSS